MARTLWALREAARAFRVASASAASSAGGLRVAGHGPPEGGRGGGTDALWGDLFWRERVADRTARKRSRSKGSP